MSIQIAVRLPDEVVAFLDAAVTSGAAPSRAALVSSSLEREMRRQAALRDVEKLHRHGPEDPDLDPLTTWATQNEALDLD